MSHVFPRVFNRTLPMAASAEGVWITDTDGKRYLDGSGGAIVVNVGHGVPEVIDAVTAQLRKTQYMHGSMFTTEAVEAYADEVAALLPMDDASDLPGVRRERGRRDGHEAGARLSPGVRGRSPGRTVIGRRGSYHGNTLGALDAGGKEPLRRPYDAVARAGTSTSRRRTSTGAGTRSTPTAAGPGMPRSWTAIDPADRARQRGRLHRGAGGRRHARRGGSAATTTGRRCVEVCRRHGVLVIADEVMTGFGGPGRWFGVDHWGVRPDILTPERAPRAGTVPFGLRGASGDGLRHRGADRVRARVHVVAQRARRRGRASGSGAR